MTRWLTALVAATIALSAAPVAALANGHVICRHHHEIASFLSRMHGESVRGVGVIADRYIFQIWLNETTETWSITRTRTNKITCLLAAGQGWDFLPAPPLGDPT